MKNKEAARHIKCQSPDNMHDALSHFDIFTYAEGDPENRKGKAVRKVESEDVQGTSSSTLTNHIEKPGLDSGDRASNKSILKSLIKLTELIQNNLDRISQNPKPVVVHATIVDFKVIWQETAWRKRK